MAAVQAGLQAFWCAGFTARARMSPHRPRLWSSPGGLRVMVVAPHPDDEVAGCGGTLLRHREAGDAVTVVVVSDGRRSRALGLSPDAMCERRHREAVSVARHLDVGLRWLGLPEGEWAEAELHSLLRGLLQEIAPQVLYAPSRIDFHPEHVAVARALGAALPEASGTAIRIYPIQVPLTAALGNLVCPIGRGIGGVAEAISLYASQRDSLLRTLRARAYAGARAGHGEPAEEFWELGADAYRRLHAAPPAALAAFRGLRRLAFTDPLAYARGQRERRRLQAVAEGRGA